MPQFVSCRTTIVRTGLSFTSQLGILSLKYDIGVFREPVSFTNRKARPRDFRRLHRAQLACRACKRLLRQDWRIYTWPLRPAHCEFGLHPILRMRRKSAIRAATAASRSGAGCPVRAELSTSGAALISCVVVPFRYRDVVLGGHGKSGDQSWKHQTCQHPGASHCME